MNKKSIKILNYINTMSKSVKQQKLKNNIMQKQCIWRRETKTD